MKRSDYWIPALVLLAVTALLALKAGDALLWPTLHNEDGKTMFGYYVNNPGFSGVFRSYLGYVSLIPNLIGFAVMKTSIPLAPYLLAWIPFGIAVFALSLFAWPRYRFLVPSDTARAAVCVTLAAVPLGNSALFTNTAFSQWHLLWILMLAVLAPAPRSRATATLELLLLALLVWTHPLSLTVAPLALVLALIRRSNADRLRSAVVLAAAAAFLALGIDAGTSVYPLGLQRVPATFDYLSARVVFESLFGNDLRLRLFGAGMAGAVHVATGVVLAALGGWLYQRRRTLTREQWVALLAIVGWVGGVTFVILVTRYIGMSEHARLWGQRYFYVQQLLVLATATVAVASQWPRLPRAGRALLLVAFVAHAGILQRTHARYFEVDQADSRRVVAFAEKVERWHPARGRLAARLTFARSGGGKWDIHIDRPGDPTIERKAKRRR